MNTAALLCSVVFFVHPTPAQEGPVQINAETRRYRQYRLQNTEPPFGLGKVKRMIGKIKRVEDANGGTAALTRTAWNRLTTPEKFTYCMLHGEMYSQNCDVMPWVMNEEDKIFGQVSGLSGEEYLSERQEAFLKKHRAEVIRLLRTTIREKGRVGLNLKEAIGDLEAYELIPDLVKVYSRDRRDNDILTVLFLLMKEGKYKPFLSSMSYQVLYGPDSSYKDFVVASPANQRLTIQRAMGYYRTRVR